jgi:hypothetical protein
MSAPADKVARVPSGPVLPFTSPTLVRFASIAFCGVLPALVLISVFAAAVGDDSVAFDFRVFLSASHAVLHGESPYPSLAASDEVIGRSYVYPPLTALVSVPFTVLPEEAAGLIVMALLAAAALAVPWVIGVRDWRCYGVLLLWPPVISGIQTGSVTLAIALLAAVGWRFRDRSALASSIAIGVTLTAKIFLWPLVVWLAATRRVGRAVSALAIGVGILLASWAAIGFAGLADYPSLLRRLQDAEGADSYTAYIVGLDLGLPSAVARAVWLAVGLVALASVIALARRGDEQTAFVVAIVASLALTPIVWLHYFALLLVVVALARPSLGVIWFVPLLMVVTPGSGHPTPFQTAWTLAVALVTVVLAVRESRGGSARVLVPAAVRA